MSDKLKQVDKGAKLFIVLGMLIETKTHVPSDDLQKSVAKIMTQIKRDDPKAFKGLLSFLKARGIYIK